MASGSGRHNYDLHKQRAVNMGKTNWTIGTDAPSWATEAGSRMKAPRYVKRIAATKPNKNASDSRDIFGDSKTDPVSHYATQHRRNFAPEYSAKSSKYTRRTPYPGFDRKTANRTNYELGLGRPTTYVSANQDQLAHPRSRTVAKSPNYRGRRDMGQGFDIVTGKDRPGKKPAPRVIPRHTQDHSLSATTRTAAYNIISGRLERKHHAPKPSVAARAEKPPLRTLLALRPPTQR